MKWVTREKVHVDRVACPWLIKRFIDPEAEFIFVPRDTDPSTIKEGIPFDIKGWNSGIMVINVHLMHLWRSTIFRILH